jgi:anti-sigma B factor antagonist
LTARAAAYREAASAKARLRVSASGRQGRSAVVELEGEYDLDTVPDIDRQLRRALGPLYHQDHLVIDLAGTTFVDSSFIAFVVRLAAALRTRRRELLLVRPSGQVRKVFGIVGLANVVPVFESVEAAQDSLRAGKMPVIPPSFTTAGA